MYLQIVCGTGCLLAFFVNFWKHHLFNVRCVICFWQFTCSRLILLFLMMMMIWRAPARVLCRVVAASLFVLAVVVVVVCCCRCIWQEQRSEASRTQQELREKLDESKATCVRIETLNSLKCDELLCLERQVDRLKQQHSVSFALTYSILYGHQ